MASALAESFGGFSAGVIGTVIGFPLDLVKTRLQTNAASSSATLTSTFSHIVKTEGVGGLYKGVATPLLSLTILNTLNFTSYNYFKKRLGGDGQSALGLSACFVSGALAGPLASIISTPEHMLKTQMQIDNARLGGPIYTRGSLDAARHLVRKHGFLSLYRGHNSNTVRECAFLGVYFASYEAMRTALPDNKVRMRVYVRMSPTSVRTEPC